MSQENVDILIIGAGPSGSVAASYLHNNGIKIKVIEKSVFPRFVIGESLLPRCMDHFEEVDLLQPLKDFGFEIKSGARFMRGEEICNFDFGKKHGDGWDWTWQVPRADFDSVLTDTLIKRGVDIVFDHAVIDVNIQEEKSIITIEDGKGNKSEITAKFIIDSSGYGRVLPRLLDLEKTSPLPKHSSIFAHVNDKNRPEGEEGTLITFDVLSKETWLWVIPFSNGHTSIGLVGPTKYVDSFTGTNEEKLRKIIQLSEYYKNRFEDVEYDFEPKLIKNYSKSVKQIYGKGYALTGNSAEFLDPVFSSGVTFATESALLAAKLAARELKGEFINWEKEYYGHIKEGVAVFGTYVKEWYTGNLQKIFFHRPENPEIKKQICAVLAGYVWDKTNPFVKNHNRLVRTVAKVIDMESAEQKV